jgi:3-oxoadipate enol-lactonase
MPFAPLPEARIHYALTGRENASVLVFSNSLGTNFSMWDIQAAAFDSRLCILRYDTRGHGQSGVTPGPYSIEQLARDVLGLLDHLHLDRVSFCGLSMGGQIGQWLGLHAANRLDKLILCNTGAKIGNDEGWNARIVAVRSKGMKEVAPAVVARWFTPGFQQQHPDTVSGTLRILEATAPEGYAACCAAVRDFDARDAVSRISVPTLVITGAYDPATPPAEGRFLAAKIPGARYAELNAAHLSNIEDRDRFNQEIASFLAV